MEDERNMRKKNREIYEKENEDIFDKYLHVIGASIINFLYEQMEGV
jgi:hypothetical protein